MSKPVFGNGTFDTNTDSLAGHTTASFTPGANGQWIYLEGSFGPPGNAGASTVSTVTNTGTALTWAKIVENTTTGGGVSVWRAFQATAAAITITWTLSQTPTQTTAFAATVRSYTAATTRVSQTGAVTNTASPSASATPSIALTTGANNSLLSGVWHQGVNTTTHPTITDGANTTTRQDDFDATFPSWRTDYTGSTATAGTFTQAVTLSGSVTTMTGVIAAYEVIGLGEGLFIATPPKSVRQAVRRSVDW